MSKFTRRTFLKTGSVALAATAIPYRIAKASPADQAVNEILADQDWKGLTSAALEAAKAAGANYADAHFKFNRSESWNPILGTDYPQPYPYTVLGFSVRSLVNGYWGFAAMSGIATVDDAARFGRDATAQAKTSSAKGKPRTVDLTPLQHVASGTWSMPVQIDPFSVSFEEKMDFMTAMNDYVARQRWGIGAGAGLNISREERIFSSTEGAFTNQTVYSTGAGLNVNVKSDWMPPERGGFRGANFLSSSGAGWEYIRNNKFKDEIAGMIEEALRSRRVKPVDVGRYDMIFDAQALAGIIAATIGASTELDRAFGYEANTIGTSYFTEPLENLGTFKVGSPLLNVTANRSMPGGLANVKWDSEGVEPIETTLVKDGMLNDFQTTRESASWIADYYKKVNVPVRSNGSAGQYSPTSTVTQVTQNIVLAPGATEVSVDQMIKDTKKGLLVLGGYTFADHQALNGAGQGDIVYEIVDGKRGQPILGAQYLYRAPDFWKNLVALGGKSAVQQFGKQAYRSGQSPYTVSCVPAKITGVAVTDVMRKA